MHNTELQKLCIFFSLTSFSVYRKSFKFVTYNVGFIAVFLYKDFVLDSCDEYEKFLILMFQSPCAYCHIEELNFCVHAIYVFAQYLNIIDINRAE